MKHEPNKSLTEADIAPFEFKGEVEVPEGVTPALLADLHNVVFTFGAERKRLGGPTERILSQWSPVELHVVVNVNPDVTSVIIFGEGGQATEGIHGGELVSGGLLFWDNRVSVLQVIAFIELADAQFKSRGWFDEETGARERKENIIEPPSKRSVKRTFQNPISMFPVPNGVDPRVFREQFDKPEKLSVILTPFGAHVLCLAEHCGIILATMRRRMEALEEMGYNEESIAQLSFDEIKELLSHLELMERQ